VKQDIKSALQVKLVSWPTPQDYNEALQNPKQSFSDPELAAGKPALTPLGLPKPMTGAFASVYRMHCKNRDWAVRCFLRNFPDQHDRYNKIEEHILAAKLPFTVGFDYIEDGLRLHSEHYPILKMEWAEGQHLDQFIVHNLHNPKLLSETADAWKEMLGKLRENGIAHGDLQHGNVLVDNKTFELVDYDGMYVPALEGMGSNELGHRNYQHPGRTKDHFGLYLDNFPGWLIYVSLKILSLDPTLWKDLQGGDECLLFRQLDLKDPLHSKAFSFLEHHKSPEIQKLSRQLRSFLRSEVDDVPNLDASVADPQGLPAVLPWDQLRAQLETEQPSANQPPWVNAQSFGQSQSSYSPKPSQYSSQVNWPPPYYGSGGQPTTGKFGKIGPSELLPACLLAIFWMVWMLQNGIIVASDVIGNVRNALAPLLTAIAWEWSWPIWLFGLSIIVAGLFVASKTLSSSSSSHTATTNQVIWQVVIGAAIVMAPLFFIISGGNLNTSAPQYLDPLRLSNDRAAEEFCSFANECAKRGDYGSAAGIYRQGLAKYVKNYSKDPNTYFPKIIKTLNALGETYQRQGNTQMANKYLSKSTQLVHLRDSGKLTDKDIFLLP
jgi:hypothetical protein